MAKLTKKPTKKLKALKPDRPTEIVEPLRVVPTTVSSTIACQAPLAYRNEMRALAVKQSLEDIITKLHSYQELGAAKDLNEFLEVTLRASLDTIGAVVVKLNVPPAYFPAQAEIARKEAAAKREKEAMEVYMRMSELKR
jgi:hypothetical protein